MKVTAGFLLLIVALGTLGLGVLWLVGAATGGEWDLEVAGTWLDGLLVSFILIGLAGVLVVVAVRLVRAPSR